MVRSDGAVATLDGGEVLRQAGIADADVGPGMDVTRVNSSDMTPDLTIRVAAECRRLLADPDVAGVVVLHGTEPMEETAFDRDLTGPSSEPAVFTGAMRPVGSVDADGQENVRRAIAPARHDDAGQSRRRRVRGWTRGCGEVAAQGGLARRPPLCCATAWRSGHLRERRPPAPFAACRVLALGSANPGRAASGGPTGDRLYRDAAEASARGDRDPGRPGTGPEGVWRGEPARQPPHPSKSSRKAASWSPWPREWWRRAAPSRFTGAGRPCRPDRHRGREQFLADGREDSTASPTCLASMVADPLALFARAVQSPAPEFGNPS